MPKNRKTIKCKWNFTLKYNKDGSVEEYKARLVAKGSIQKFGINFKETFSPVARYSTIRFILALSTELDLGVDQMDIATAFLNGTLNEDVQSEGFVDKDFPKKVCRLGKSLYGLKQAGRQWNICLDDALIANGFMKLKSETCLYVKGNHPENNYCNLCRRFVTCFSFGNFATGG